MKKMMSIQIVRSLTAAGCMALGLLCAVPAQAQEAASEASMYAARVGFVNTDRLFAETRAAQAALTKLKREFSKRESELNEQGSRLKAAIEQFEKTAATLDEKQRAEKWAALQAQELRFEQGRREFQEDLNNRKNEELQKLLDQANRVVIQVAKDNKIDVVLQEAVYVNRRLDITDKVIEVLNNQK